MLLMLAQIKPKSSELRQNSFTRGGVPHVSVRAWALGCFQSYQYPNLSEGTDHVSGQLCGDKKCHFSGITKCGSLEEGAGERCSECDISLTHTNPQSSYCGHITHAHRHSTSVTVCIYHTHTWTFNISYHQQIMHTHRPSTSVTAGIWHKQTFSVSITNRHTQTFNVHYCQHNSQRISTAVTVGT